MKSLIIWSGAAVLLASRLAWAGTLDQSLTSYFQQRLVGDGVSVTVKTANAQLPPCPLPEFSLPGSARLWGNVSVMARCGSDKRFIQVEVIANGRYVVAAHAIARGATLDKESVRLKQGRLDQLPPGTMMDLSQASDAVALRDIAPDQPVMQSMVRQAWRVKAGQQVQVIASGEGFSVNGSGKALNNAAVAQSARVRMSSGQVVSGTVDSDGNILINL